MYRINENIYFTAEDKKNLVIKKYTNAEILENKKYFNKKRNKLRIVLLALLTSAIILFFGGNESQKCIVEVAIMILSFILVLIEYVNRINYKIISGEYYIEVIIVGKKEIETYIDYSVTTGSSVVNFYPIVGRDSTSGYESIFYISQEEYEKSVYGQKIKMNRRGLSYDT